jgi:hypothetical protein
MQRKSETVRSEQSKKKKIEESEESEEIEDKEAFILEDHDDYDSDVLEDLEEREKTTTNNINDLLTKIQATIKSMMDNEGFSKKKKKEIESKYNGLKKLKDNKLFDELKVGVFAKQSEGKSTVLSLLLLGNYQKDEKLTPCKSSYTGLSTTRVPFEFIYSEKKIVTICYLSEEDYKDMNKDLTNEDDLMKTNEGFSKWGTKENIVESDDELNVFIKEYREIVDQIKHDDMRRIEKIVIKAPFEVLKNNITIYDVK